MIFFHKFVDWTEPAGIKAKLVDDYRAPSGQQETRRNL